MKGMFWFLLLVLAFLFGLLFFNLRREYRRGAGVVISDVSGDSIKVYDARVAELERNAAALRNRLLSAGGVERLRLERRLEILDREVIKLKSAIAQWRLAREAKSATEIYHQCLLLYGKASGICELLATDTLPAPGRER